MRIVLITQGEPFFLADALNYLLSKLSQETKIVGCVLLDVAAFGRKKSMLEQAKETYSIFGFHFTLIYGLKYLVNKLNRAKSVAHALKSYDIPIIKLSKGINNPISITAIRALNPDLLISIAGNQIFKEPIIQLAPKGCLNLHTALLPKYRGLMPSFWVLKNNETETGVSVFFVDEGIDSGPIIVQKRISIGNMSQEELIVFSKKIGMDAILEAVKLINSGEYGVMENLESNSSYYSKPTKNDVLDFYRSGKKFF